MNNGDFTQHREESLAKVVAIEPPVDL